jgi:hypothetical protein
LGIAAAAVATNTTDFCPDAWEVAAAAAAAAAAAEDGQSQSHPSGPADRSASRLAALPEPCWAVKTLAEAVQAATEAALQYAQSAQPERSGQTPAAASSGSNAPCVQELLLLPASEAAQQLLQLSAAQRAGVLLLLCGADGVQATGASIACFGSRGEAWLLLVLDGVAADLGLLEMGVLLAATYHRWVMPSYVMLAMIETIGVCCRADDAARVPSELMPRHSLPVLLAMYSRGATIAGPA